MNPPTTKVTPISGFPELLPAERLLELHFLDVIREVFELHGFAPLETRAVEPVERLLGKGGDADKEIYGITRLAGDDSGRDAALGLHFDLTVPFARYVLENAGKLAFPFRRYQIQKVWRGERPQEGRFREFTQADIDVVDVGELAPALRGRDAARHRRGVRPAAGGGVPHPGQQPQDPRGLLPRHRARRRRRHAAHRRQARARSARDRSPRCSSSRGRARTRRGRCWPWPSISSTDLSFVDAVRALGVQHPTLDEGLDALAAVIAVGMEQAPGVLVADLQHRPRPGLLHRHGLRDPARRLRVVGLGLLRRPLRLAGQRRPHHLPRRRHLDRADPARAPARRQARAHREPLHARGGARRGRRRGEPGGLPAGGGGAAGARHPLRGRTQRGAGSASRSATPTGAASRSSGSPARATTAATRSRTSARASRSTPTRRPGSARPRTSGRPSSRRSRRPAQAVVGAGGCSPLSRSSSRARA